MISFRVVPLRLEIRGMTFKRGDIIHFDKLYLHGAGPPYHYRMWESGHPPFRKWQYFTQKQLDAMQPHWLTRQEELDL